MSKAVGHPGRKGLQHSPTITVLMVRCTTPPNEAPSHSSVHARMPYLEKKKPVSM